MKVESPNSYTLITGASQGIGKAFAEECASRGMNLILTALAGEGLKTLSVELEKKFGVDVKYFEGDLTQIEFIEYLIKEVNQSFKVNILINNAGLGGSCSFDQSSLSDLNDIILLNNRALALLCRGFLENLKSHNKAYILNMASLASFGPMPYKSVYPASKAFVLSFSRGLDAELKNEGVRVCVVCPGGIPTNPNVSVRIAKYKGFIRASILQPGEVAKMSIGAMLKDMSIIIPGYGNKLSWLVLKLLPDSLKLKIFRKSLLKEIEVNNEK